MSDASWTPWCIRFRRHHREHDMLFFCLSVLDVLLVDGEVERDWNGQVLRISSKSTSVKLFVHFHAK